MAGIGQGLVRRLKRELPAGVALDGEALLTTYDGDAYPVERHRPDLVVLPETVEQAQFAVRLCSEAGVPFVPRGAGTGLSGGCLAVRGGVVISTKRLNKLVGIDPVERIAHVQAGIANAKLSEAAQPFGLHFAPDPSSQSVSTIGGNVATNAGGPHTLKYGVTAPHILKLKIVDSRGEVFELGSLVEDEPGYDVLSMVIGSEGTIGLIVEVWARLMPIPPAVETALASFASAREATEAVASMLARGAVPAALEMMDHNILGALTAAFGLTYPAGTRALLLVECDGEPAATAREIVEVRRACEEAGAIEVRIAADEVERAALWHGRKKGIGAMGRIAPAIVTHDGVVPPSKLPDVLDDVDRISAETGVRIANIFHAGDGNLHPVCCFDDRDPDQVAAVWVAAERILRRCVELGGSVTGEHGIGVEKAQMLRLMYGPADLKLQHDALAIFDVNPACNPGKVFPPDFLESLA